MIAENTLVFDKISNREGKVITVMGSGSCVIETVDNERFTQKIKLLTKIDKLAKSAKTTTK